MTRVPSHLTSHLTTAGTTLSHPNLVSCLVVAFMQSLVFICPLSFYEEEHPPVIAVRGPAKHIPKNKNQRRRPQTHEEAGQSEN